MVGGQLLINYYLYPRLTVTLVEDPPLSLAASRYHTFLMPLKRTLLTIAIVGLIAFLAYWVPQMSKFVNGVKQDAVRLEQFHLEQKIQEGDIIFQTSRSSQSQAIQLATDSKYSHMGLIYETDGAYFVFEAVSPVKLTPLNDWILRGENGHYIIKRLIDSKKILTPSVIMEMKAIGERFLGKPYDIYFEWSDDRIYCSELVWKVYKETTGLEIGGLEKLSDFDLTNELVKQKMEERYGDKIPFNEFVISPVAMFNSDRLITISQK